MKDAVDDGSFCADHENKEELLAELKGRIDKIDEAAQDKCPGTHNNTKLPKISSLCNSNPIRIALPWQHLLGFHSRQMKHFVELYCITRKLDIFLYNII